MNGIEYVFNKPEFSKGLTSGIEYTNINDRNIRNKNIIDHSNHRISNNINTYITSKCDIFNQ